MNDVLNGQMIDLPVNGSIMRIKWDNSKFTAIIPNSNNSSTLAYGEQQFQLDISSEEFIKFLDSISSKDEMISGIRNIIESTPLTGVRHYYFEDFGENYWKDGLSVESLCQQIMEVKWDTRITDIRLGKGKKPLPAIKTQTNITITVLSLCEGKHHTASLEFLITDDLKKQKTLPERIDKELLSLYQKYLRKEWSKHWGFNIWSRNSAYGKMEFVPIHNNVHLKLYSGDISPYYTSGVALDAQLSRFGNISQNMVAVTTSQILADAKIKAAAVIAMGPVICEKYRKIESDERANEKYKNDPYWKQRDTDGARTKIGNMLQGNF